MTKFQKEVSSFLQIPEFSYNTVYRIGKKKLPCQPTASSIRPCSCFDIIAAVTDKQTDSHTMTAYTALA